MENLETQILNRLNKVLINDNLIIAPIYPPNEIHLEINELFNRTCLFNFGVFSSIDHLCLYCWTTFYNMLFSQFCVFNVCNKIKYCKGDSLEEIAIKMDLIGI